MSNQMIILNDVKSIDDLKWCQKSIDDLKWCKSIDDFKWCKSIDRLKWWQINWWSQIVPTLLMILNGVKAIDDLKWCQINWWF